MKKVEKSPQDDFFSHRLGDSETKHYTIRIHSYWGKTYYPPSARYLDFPEEIVATMGLEVGKSVGWKRREDSLMMTPLPESILTTKVQLILVHYFNTAIPVMMMAASGLEYGDYVSLRVEDGCLRVTKAEGAGMNVVKIGRKGGEIGVSIPVVIAEELKLDAEKVRKGVWILWTFDEEGLLGKFQNKNPHIERIIHYNRDGARQLTVNIPSELAEWIKNNDDVVLQMKNRRLYVTKKE
jgi:antitoxin component of MazEF toxin-antitoxin module